ncbi:unnamed protein product [Heligmosomoides polygyrus]|uniref:Protein kinase domain-containing protein n=1 Tax=Heligmosomoides polygyrus TaxID=6339 RepID=A0A183FH36_HELPZ|nr:unnamed protein product [Heligmosomoides polygyrus]
MPCESNGDLKFSYFISFTRHYQKHCMVLTLVRKGLGIFSSSLFKKFVQNFMGVSEERNEIVMEVDIDDFEKSVAGSHSYLKIKLRQKSPFLQLELRDRGTIHELPVKLIKTAHWPLYQRPDLPNIYFPPIKSVMRVLQSLKHVGNRHIVRVSDFVLFELLLYDVVVFCNLDNIVYSLTTVLQLK